MPRYLSYSNRLKADDLLKIRVWWLGQRGFLKCGETGQLTWSSQFWSEVRVVGFSCQQWRDGQLFLRLRYNTVDEEIDEMVVLTSTKCHFGGQRHWFTCPAIRDGRMCGKRVGVLYLGHKFFLCRHCLNLTYDSTNLGGHKKRHGTIISYPQYKKAQNEIRRYFYGGKKTKRFKRFLKLQNKLCRQLGSMAVINSEGK